MYGKERDTTETGTGNRQTMGRGLGGRRTGQKEEGRQRQSVSLLFPQSQAHTEKAAHGQGEKEERGGDHHHATTRGCMHSTAGEHASERITCTNLCPFEWVGVCEEREYLLQLRLGEREREREREREGVCVCVCVIE